MLVAAGQKITRNGRAAGSASRLISRQGTGYISHGNIKFITIYLFYFQKNYVMSCVLVIYLTRIIRNNNKNWLQIDLFSNASVKRNVMQINFDISHVHSPFSEAPTDL